jgi:hypothetical protein
LQAYGIVIIAKVVKLSTPCREANNNMDTITSGMTATRTVGRTAGETIETSHTGTSTAEGRPATAEMPATVEIQTTLLASSGTPAATEVQETVLTGWGNSRKNSVSTGTAKNS